LKKQKCWTLFCEFFSYFGPKNHFRAGRHENKEKRLFKFGFRILLPIQIQLFANENPKNQELDFAYCERKEIFFYFFLS
jgi:hypothetical protein